MSFRLFLLALSIGVCVVGIVLLATGDTVGGGYSIALGVLTIPLNVYRLRHPLRERPRRGSDAGKNP